jgi:uncharacterized protein (TIGR02145 family)
MIENKLSLVKSVLILIILFSLGIVLGVTTYSLSFKKSPSIAIQPTIKPTIKPTASLESMVTPTPMSTPTAKKNSYFFCGKSTATDTDNNTYNTIQIGSQCWMKENLKVTKNPEGNAITRYCYDNDPKICNTDGGLYDWNTAMNNSTQEGSQGICPNGWHIPKDSEWYKLEKGLSTGPCTASRIGMTECDSVGTKLKTGGSSGFEAILTGHLFWASGESEGRGTDAELWSSTRTYNSRVEGLNNAFARGLDLSSSNISRDSLSQIDFYSVRCLKN